MQTCTTFRQMCGCEITPIFGFRTISPFKRYNFLLKTLFVHLRVYYKSLLARLTICASLWMLQTDFRFD